MKKQKFLKNAPTFLLLTKHLNTWCDCTHLNEPHRTFSDTGKWNCDCIFVNYEYGMLWSPYSTYSHIRHFLLINTFPHPIWLWPLSLQCNASIPHYDWRQLVLERMSSFVWTNGLVHSYYLVSGSVWLRETVICATWYIVESLPHPSLHKIHRLSLTTSWKSTPRESLAFEPTSRSISVRIRVSGSRAEWLARVRKWRYKLRRRAHGRQVMFSLVTSPRAPPGEKRSGERSRISWAYYSKAVRTNEIARSVIIT